MATDKNRIMISLDDKNLEKLENSVDYFDDIMGAIYSKK